jgi:DNA-binding transcriptional ArsR family regulator
MVTYCDSVEQGGEVFRALADPSRRALLDSLFSRDGQTLNELCDELPGMTRFGVMKHLSVLAEANLVVTTRYGRTKRHYLNPVPIEQVANRWISKYAACFTAALVALDEQVAVDDQSQTGSRAAVLRRREPTRISSASDDKVGGFPTRSARSELGERSNQMRAEPA